MSARTENLPGDRPGVWLAWYVALLAGLMLLVAAVTATPRVASEPIPRPNVAPTLIELSPGATAASRIDVRVPFDRASGPGRFRGTVKEGPTPGASRLDVTRLPGPSRGTVKIGRAG